MGLGMGDVEYLSARGYLSKASPKVLDIGSQCLFNVTPERVKRFVSGHGASVSDEELSAEAERISYFSTPRPNERTTYLSELLGLTPIWYTSFDICPALKTEIFDLNTQSIPEHYREYFDVALNCGTTEHVINQANCLQVMHEALAVGGVMLHQVPATGYLGHGYFCYHEEFFRDFAEANAYAVDDLWYTATSASNLDLLANDVRDPDSPVIPRSECRPVSTMIPGFNINAVLRKVSSQPMRFPLELATAHALPAEVKGTREQDTSSSTVPSYRHLRGATLLRELGFRVLRRLHLT